MDYRYLKTFLLVAETSSFSRAAETLHIAQSAVSRQIRLLEESLRCQLFIRAPHHVSMTPQGKALFDQASRFDAWSDSVFQNERPLIRIGTLPGAVESVLLKKIAAFSHATDVNLNIRIDSQPTLVDLMAAGELDFCLIHDVAALPQGALKVRKLFQEQIVLISKREIDVKNLQKYTWLHMGTSSYLRKLATAESSQFIIANSIQALIQMAAMGLGVAAVPDHAVPIDLPLRVYPTKLKGSLYLASPQRAVWGPMVQEFAELF